VKKAGKLTKVVDDTAPVRCKIGKGIIREEVWQETSGRLAKYNLAFINFSLYPKDNGRVLGYDNNHGQHHRHHMGQQSEFGFVSYQDLIDRFIAEVAKLKEQESAV
jgi:hypothetical protein